MWNSRFKGEVKQVEEYDASARLDKLKKITITGPYTNSQFNGKCERVDEYDASSHAEKLKKITITGPMTKGRFNGDCTEVTEFDEGHPSNLKKDNDNRLQDER